MKRTDPATRVKRSFASDANSLQGLTNLLGKYGFVHAGEIVLAAGQLAIVLLKTEKTIGYVYVWLEASRTGAQVVYVGKAGNTLKARCDQHSSGYRFSQTGQAHAQRLRAGLAQGNRYLIYAKKSAVARILEEDGIPMEAVEEIALIKKLRPCWNRT